MQTKLSRYCEGVIEAAWLAAVILVPIYFNIYSSRIFEPDKIALLRSLALVILACWLIKSFSEGGIDWSGLRSAGSRSILRMPLVLPVSALAAIYLLSTVFSVTPRVSFWGSYQRLQGTYTTFSYLIIFLAMLGNLRRRDQIDRLVSTIVLTSVPVALYGVLQRYQIDPIPWGGDTSRRIAANMGNSIFIAAYLIMVFPLTIGRIVQSFGTILKTEQILGSQIARGTVYVFAGVIQLMAIYMSGSRGPALGLLAGTFFLMLLLSLHWQKRWLTFGIIGTTMVVSVFLLIFNLPGGPLESLHASPVIGRFGLLLDAESNSALVRKYIWQGAAEMVKPHAPIEFPDGSRDSFNSLRLLFGYGPESMYVAYNPFYVPELAKVERRNASPDRSHNESWDSLVITGLAGVLVYLALFSLVFYYGSKWVGIIANWKQRNIFLLLLMGSVIAGAIVFGLWRGLEYIGVGLPFGMLIGFLSFLAITSLFSRPNQIKSADQGFRAITLIVVIAGIVAHFVEINFGIAIASTRIYFWVYAALLVCVGFLVPQEGESTNSPTLANQVELPLKTRKKRRSRELERKSPGFGEAAAQEWLPGAMSVAITLVALGYDFITNPSGARNSFEVIWRAFTRLPNRGDALSLGVLALFITTWVMISLVHAVESDAHKSAASIWQSFAWILLFSGAVALFFWIWHANSLASVARNVASTVDGVLEQVYRYEALLAKFYIFLGLLVFGSAYFLSAENIRTAGKVKWTSVVTTTAILVVTFFLTAITNLRVIQADVAFKLADPFTNGNQWPVAIQIYNRANSLAPNEDYYYLFLGRAYIEHAKQINERSQQESLIKQAESDLRKAQAINPLNTDHTANLARLYNLWSLLTQDLEEQMTKAKISSDYFSRAVVLSPHNARLWDEWALLYLNAFKQPEEAFERLNKALEIDPNYHWTYALLGDVYSLWARSSTQQAEREQYLEQAVDDYLRAIELPAPGDALAKHNYSLALGAAMTQLNRVPEAIGYYQQAIDAAPNNVAVWRVEEVIASLYIQLGDAQSASLYLTRAIKSAPSDEAGRLQVLLNQLQSK